jgi:hypothetical protein
MMGCISSRRLFAQTCKSLMAVKSHIDKARTRSCSVSDNVFTRKSKLWKAIDLLLLFLTFSHLLLSITLLFIHLPNF